MPGSLITYAEWIELETFFSGYLLVYAIIYLIASNSRFADFVKTWLLPNLPRAYAFTGTLYLGLQLKNMYPDYSIDHFAGNASFLYLKIWALFSIFFWIPVLQRKAVYSLLHSLVFFWILIKSFYLQFTSNSDGSDMTKNSIKIYSASILINLLALILVALTSLLIARFKKQNDLPNDPG